MSLNGILIIDKPGGMTSHDVVQRARKLLKTSKVGHLGTLDPMATGVLPLCIGKATRLGQFLTGQTKEYVGDIRFGFATTTCDREGEATGPDRPFLGAAAEVEEAMRELTGSIEQTPPVISAKKIGGEPSYKLARRGLVVESPPVRVEVRSFELTRFSPPLAGFRVLCSAGTYVRSLAHELGRRLGCGAHLDSLRRLQSSGFGIDRAVALGDASISDVLPIETLLPDFPKLVVLTDDEEDRVRHGNPIRTAEGGGFARIFNKQGEFLAVGAIESGWAHPRVVLISGTSVSTPKASLRQYD